MLRWTLDRAEDVYHSNSREPLGKTWMRGHTLPPGMGTDIAFGQTLSAQENSAISQARQAIAPVDRPYDVRCLLLQLMYIHAACMFSPIKADDNRMIAMEPALMSTSTVFAQLVVVPLLLPQLAQSSKALAG